MEETRRCCALNINDRYEQKHFIKRIGVGVVRIINNKINKYECKRVFSKKKGIHNLDTKKRYNEVISWMEEYAALRQPSVMQRTLEMKLEAYKSVCAWFEKEYDSSVDEDTVREWEDKGKELNTQINLLRHLIVATKQYDT